MAARTVGITPQNDAGAEGVTITSLHKAFHAGLPGCSARVNVLNGVDLAVKRGEIVAIVGTIGAGKTTLLLCAAGLLRPDAGTVIVRGSATYLGTPSHRADAQGALTHALHTRDVLLLDGILPLLGAADRMQLRAWAAEGGTAVVAERNLGDTGTLPHRIVTLAHGTLSDVVLRQKRRPATRIRRAPRDLDLELV